MSSEKVSICPIYHSYNIVSRILESKYLRNPVKKVKVFKENTKLLDSLVASHPKKKENSFFKIFNSIKCSKNTRIYYFC